MALTPSLPPAPKGGVGYRVVHGRNDDSYREEPMVVNGKPMIPYGKKLWQAEASQGLGIRSSPLPKKGEERKEEKENWENGSG